MEWEELNSKAQSLAYEFLKKKGNPHAEDFNPDTSVCGILFGGSEYFEDIDNDYCAGNMVKGIRISIVTRPKNSTRVKENR